MVRGEHDHRAVGQSALFQKTKQHAELVVDLLDQPHVGGNHPRPYLVAGEIPRHPQVHERAIDRMRIAPFPVRPPHRNDIVRAEHVVIRRRRDVRPVRLDIREMQTPRPPVIRRRVDEIHRPPRHVRRFRMLLGHARLLVGVRQQPAVLHLAIFIGARIGPLLPRIIPVVAEILQIPVVARPRRRIGVQSVVAFERLEAAFADMHAHAGIGRNTKPRHPSGIRLHVRLAHQHVAHADFAKVLAQRRLTDPQRKPVPVGAVRTHVAAGVKTHARRPAHRRLHVGAGKPHATRRQRIDVRRRQAWVAVAAQIVEPQLVAHDPQHVAHRLRRSSVHSLGAACGELHLPPQPFHERHALIRVKTNLVDEPVAERPNYQVPGAGILESMQFGIVGPITESVAWPDVDPLLPMQQRASARHHNEDFLLEHVPMPPRRTKTRRHRLDIQPDRLRADGAPDIRHPPADRAAKTIVERPHIGDLDASQRH